MQWAELQITKQTLKGQPNLYLVGSGNHCGSLTFFFFFPGSFIEFKATNLAQSPAKLQPQLGQSFPFDLPKQLL